MMYKTWKVNTGSVLSVGLLVPEPPEFAVSSAEFLLRIIPGRSHQQLHCKVISCIILTSRACEMAFDDWTN